MSLFANTEKKNLEKARPLAARMRPTQLNEFVGQRHFLGEGELLWRLVKADQLGSVIFYGPPGTGKTTLARILAGETQKHDFNHPPKSKAAFRMPTQGDFICNPHLVCEFGIFPVEGLLAHR